MLYKFITVPKETEKGALQMKIKTIPIIMILSVIIICVPTHIFAWLQDSTYEACNIINSGISWLLKTISFIIVINYIIGTIRYIKSSKVRKNQKIRNLLTWLTITIVQVSFLLAGALWVTEIGMETYWATGKRVQTNEMAGYITYVIRGVALILIIMYIITAIIYIAKSKQKKIRKIENVIRGQMITFGIVAGLLVFAMNW